VTRRSTLRGRLAIAALLATAVWVGLLTVGFNVVMKSRLHQQADEVLRTRASATAGLVDVGRNGRVQLREPANDEALDTNIWVYQGAVAVERPPGRNRLQHEADMLARRPGGGYRDTTSGPATRLYAFPVLVHHRQVATVVTAVDVVPYVRAAGLTLWGSAGFAVLLLAGTYVSTRAVVARALRPVDEMTQQAADWSAHDVENRFGVAPRPAELDALAGTLDELLARQAAALRHEQQLSAELSHELRTPLASIVAEAELLTRRVRTTAETRRAHEAIAASAARMTHIVETLLSDARTRIGQAPGRCALLPAVEELVRRLDGKPGGPAVRVSGDPVAVGLGADVVARILTPVVDNALRYAATTVQITAARADGVVEVSVRDDGPGVPEGWEQAVFEPGWRAEPDDAHGGAGLGLALAVRLAQAGGGGIRLLPARPGATFVVALPPG
jgi:signal transduction histidine kinase